MKHLLAAFLCLAIAAALIPSALAQDKDTTNTCTFSANSDVTAYSSADTSAATFPLSAGDGGYIVGATADPQWYGFDPGIAQAGNLGLTRLKWIPADADVTLSGDCANLPPLEPPPTQGCYLTFGADVSSYMQPEPMAASSATLTANDYALLAGQQSNGWYGWSDPGGQAGSIGTIQLRWIAAGDEVQVNGDCDALPTFYPAPALVGDICTVLANEDGEAYTQPTDDADSTSVAGLQAQALARTDGWYGFDPADAQDGAVGVTRLRWIPEADVDQANGNCEDIPLIHPVPTLLSQQDSGKAVSVNKGDSIVIALTSDETWAPDAASDGTNDENVLQQQGAPLQGKDGISVTYQAMNAGETTLALTNSAGESFSLDVTVTAET